MHIELFINANGTQIDSGISVVQTTGYSSAGLGSGQYVHTPTFSFSRPAATSNGSAVVSGLSITGDLHVGATVSGSDIPTGTTIASIDSASQITLSAQATGSDGSASLTFGVSMTDDAFGTYWDRAAFEAADGRWFRLDIANSPVSPQMFGVRGSSTADDLPAMQNFCDFTTYFRCNDARLEGTCYLSDTLYFGRADGTEGVTPVYTGSQIIFRALSSVTSLDKMVHLRNMKDIDFSGVGRIDFRGPGSSATYSGRTTVWCGLWLDECRGAKFNYIYGSRLGFAVIATQRRNLANTANSNNNFVHIEKVQGQYVGSGDTDASTQSLTAAFTCAASPTRDTGSASDVGQVSSITVTDLSKLPPAVLHGSSQDDLGTSLSTNPVIAFVNEQPYLVRSINRSTGVVTLYPWLDPAIGTSGTVYFAWGGLVVIQGGDANVLKIDMIEGRYIGVGLALRSNQGPDVGVLSLQNDCGIGILVGDTTDPIYSGNNTLIRSFYAEGPDNHLLIVSDYDETRNSGQILSGYLHWWSESGVSNYQTIHAPKDSAYSTVDRGLGNWTINGDGVVHRAKRHPTSAGTPDHPNAESAGNQFGIIDPEMVKVVRANSLNYVLTNDIRITRIFKYDRQMLVVDGSGPNGAPTGTLTFAVDTGGSLNGVVNGTISFAGFTGPAVLLLCETANDTWLVRLISGQEQPARAGLQTRGDVSVTLGAADEQTQKWVTNLTANRTVTLSTTGVSDGQRFRVVRTAGGAPTLDVGGLKTLAASSWCEVEYDGVSAWHLVGSGSL